MLQEFTIGEAARRSGWSPRMLRYLEESGLVVPGRGNGGYRRYGIGELNQLRALSELRDRFGVGLTDMAFTVRLRSDSDLRSAVETWLAGTRNVQDDIPAWVEWEQRKHERLLSAREAA